MSIFIRLARLSDADEIAALTRQLGYEVEPPVLISRLSSILARSNQQVLVAELEGAVVGWLHAAVSEYIEAEPYVLVCGLVVHERYRGKGIGRMLLERAEDWTMKRGCTVVRLSSSASRAGAHRFYQRLGYVIIKTQYSFAKSLDPSGSKDLTRFIPRVEP